MRYPASEKLEIIQLVEQSPLPGFEPKHALYMHPQNTLRKFDRA
jgi:hypothetical protein